MTRDPRYDILFEPVKIGPVTARNRFYQVPHCNGMGTAYPSAMAAMRGIKAEGGWAVVCTEETDFHHTGDITPAIEGRLWSAQDIPIMARMAESVKRHGALAGCELVYGGHTSHNRLSREIPMTTVAMPVSGWEPGQARAMDKTDIANFRRWHRDGALRAREAGFDIVYVYAGHNLTLLQDFISRRTNRRTDEYGGSIENRVRLMREVIEDTKEAVGDTMAVAVRFAVEELEGPEGITHDGDGRAVVELLADLPDLWDVNVSEWHNDSQTARFAEEGYQEQFVSWVKQVTKKPVVAVGRYTSVDRMVSLVSRGVVDFIGAARPSIADPFLPRKIEEGRIDDIRECIGCNICVSGDYMLMPMRCTQNPTKGEEWRRGWHPERIAQKGSDARVLVVGGGPAGLEAARAAGQRGYAVTLAEAGTELGGHLNALARLPGLSTWARVRDWRIGQLHKLPNVELFLDSPLDAAQVLEFGFDHVAIATGSSWRRDGLGRSQRSPIAGWEQACVLTPDAIIAGAAVEGPVVIYDDDHYFMASVLAEKLAGEGHSVVYVSPASQAAIWTNNTMEQGRIQARLMDLGVELVLGRRLVTISDEEVELECVYSGNRTWVEAGTTVPVTMRDPVDGLFAALKADPVGLERAGVRSLRAIGDCLAPGLIAAAVYGGHRYARELDTEVPLDEAPFLRENVGLSSQWPWRSA
jgi:dimethylamine/trimethylamine dehydrogenase